MNRSLTAFAVAACLLLLQGCVTAAYVNIPPQEGQVARSNPNAQNVREVVTVALHRSLRDQPMPGRFRIALPQGTTVETYEMLVPQFGSEAVYSTDPDGEEDGLPVLDVKQVNIRGTSATVDIIRPWEPANPQGPRQLYTAYLQWEITTGWRVDETRIWRVPVDESLEESLRKSGRMPGAW